MQKAEFIKKMRDYDMAVVHFISPISKKEKFNIATLDFDNPYIRSKSRVARIEKGKLLMFCYDTDSFKQIDPKAVVRVVPFSQEMERARGSRRIANFK